MSQVFEPQSSDERIAHYREMAMEVIRLSGESHSIEMKTQFLQLAESWMALADEVERKRADFPEGGEPIPLPTDALLPA